MGGRDLAGPLDEIREVVRATGVERLAGTRPPVSGVLVLRGSPLPVVDLRSPDGEVGDVLVLASTAADAMGVAVDRVVAVLPSDALVLDEGPLPSELPDYVRGVLRGPDGAPVLLVTLRALAGLVPA
jgi:chemotaxis signal transduction protein